MNLRLKPVVRGLAVAFGGLGVLATNPVAAQQQQQLERVEVTGSAVRRIDAEAALPVQILKAEDIERTGATSVTDLLRKLPVTTGFGESGSVGGTSYGFSGVSIHNVGEQRTLVLLNGHRIAQFGGQTLTGFAAAIDLNSLPISAIDRIEILTDGASALYGSDAIAGVVNFITKRNTNVSDVTVGFSSPSGGAQEFRASGTLAFGTLENDGYNVMLTLSYDDRNKLNSIDRDFASTGKLFFSANGKNYRFQQFSPSPIPANALNDNGELISPWQRTNGSCPPKTFRAIEPYTIDGVDYVDDYCGFDYVGELEIYPERKRKTALASLTKRIGDHDLFADVLWSEKQNISRIAPVPGGIFIAAGSELHNSYLSPLGIAGDSVAFYRIYDLGKRTSDDTAQFFDLALGSRGFFYNWDYYAAYTHSESDVKGNISGYPGALAVGRLTSGGALNPFVLPGQQTPEGNEALAAVNYIGYWDGGVSTLDTFSLRGSRDLMAMSGGPMLLGLGANYNRENFESKPSLFAQGLLTDPVKGTLCDPVNAPEGCDQRFGDASAKPPYSAGRNSYGIFGELVMPALKNLEVTLSARYDHYSDFGGAATGKGSFRWTPVSTLLVRGSVGNGFHAPTVPQVNAVLQSYGVTSDDYTCTPELRQVADSLNAQCQPGQRQYDQLAGGNPNLQPEKSQQASLGFRFEPSTALSFGVDWWWVKISDAFGQLTEQEVFANPLQYSNSWAVQRDIGTGVDYLAFKADNQNLGKSYHSGFDIDFSGRMNTQIGNLTSGIKATYMMREDQQLQKDGPYFSAIGDNGELGAVTFRWQGVWSTTLKTEHFAHTLGFNFMSGYRDQEAVVEVLDGSGNVTGLEPVRLEVDNWYTFDWQTQWTPTNHIALNVGILNIFDKDPPLSLSTGGVNKGQQFGYEDRYYDPRGRTYYANFSYKF
jgi:iron complex outermembrane receptor protein